MIFTTVKKRVEKEELFPNDAVMTLVDNKFSLNKKAMKLFGFPMNVANTSKIANGYDENNNIILSTMDTKDMYTNNVTAKNDFSSQLLATRLGKFFNYNSEYPVHFKLVLEEEVANDKFIGVSLINAVNVQDGKLIYVEQDEDFYPFVEPNDEELTDIETAHADEIAQQSEVIEESPLICAEVCAEVEGFPIWSSDEIDNDLMVEAKVDPVIAMETTPVIPESITKRVINTESW